MLRDKSSHSNTRTDRKWKKKKKKKNYADSFVMQMNLSTLCCIVRFTLLLSLISFTGSWRYDPFRIMNSETLDQMSLHLCCALYHVWQEFARGPTMLDISQKRHVWSWWYIGFTSWINCVMFSCEYGPLTKGLMNTRNEFRQWRQQGWKW